MGTAVAAGSDRPGPLARLSRRWVPLPPERYEAAVAAVRPQVLAQAVLLFIGGMSIDDLHVLVFPGWLVGSVGAAAWMAAGPLVAGRLLARRLSTVPEEGQGPRLRNRTRAGVLLLLGSLVLLAVWLAYFSEGVPPWAL